VLLISGFKRKKMRSNTLIFTSLFIIFITLSFSAYAEKRRSHKAKNLFKATHHCPSTGRPKGSCPGYIIDHIVPLACGGSDTPENMQWQTKQEAKAKDKWERRGC
jgi:5-methylcytosine-specific restriction endonuclease McrA